jgi:hypothetical protein
MSWMHFRRTSRWVIPVSSPDPLDLHLKVTNRSLNEGVSANQNLPLVITYSIFGYFFSRVRECEPEFYRR